LAIVYNLNAAGGRRCVSMYTVRQWIRALRMAYDVVWHDTQKIGLILFVCDAPPPHTSYLRHATPHLPDCVNRPLHMYIYAICRKSKCRKNNENGEFFISLLIAPRRVFIPPQELCRCILECKIDCFDD
jgi:hypothetical protein